MAPDRVANALDNLIVQIVPPRGPNEGQDSWLSRYNLSHELVRTIINTWVDVCTIGSVHLFESQGSLLTTSSVTVHLILTSCQTSTGPPIQSNESSYRATLPTRSDSQISTLDCLRSPCSSQNGQSYICYTLWPTLQIPELPLHPSASSSPHLRIIVKLSREMQSRSVPGLDQSLSLCQG